MEKAKDILNYIKLLEAKEGGFSMGQNIPPNVDDTYFAVMSLTILSKYSTDAKKYYNLLRKNKKFIKYLKNYEIPKNSMTKLIYRYAVLCKAFEIPVYFDKSMVQNDMITLEDLYYLNLTKRLISNESPFDDTIYKLNSDAMEDNFEDTRFSAFAYDPLQAKYIHSVYQASFLFCRNWIKDKEKWSELHNWFRLCQNPDGGYGFYPKTTSYMDNCYWAFKAYKVFGIPPAFPERLLDFVLSCKTKIGGLGRRHGTVPSPEYTYYGLCWLETLAKDLLLDHTS